MHDTAFPPLVDARWLAEHRHDPRVLVVDASFFMPAQRRDAKAEFAAAHIPGARFFDIDVIADAATPLPHMLPAPAFFAHQVGRLGIANDSHIVAYDDNDFMASARVWWTFRVFGHDRISVLDGGFQSWRDLGLPVSSEDTPRAERPFRAGFRPELVIDLEAMRKATTERTIQVLDARSPGRFTGTEPEPRPGLRSGHIPGSRNLFFKRLIDETSHRFKSVADLAALYREAGIDLNRPVAATCGTGVTAAVLALGLYLLGRSDTAVYDGSWTEWGGRTDTPVETG
ncbi:MULTISPECIES: 3-mercaptopyruvate sulfurtransferase [Methylococcus]|uniref:3-mercaptopyruvate sulfurtransferase n=1 Tax=Methylococcus capsulatus TaxID=414 RepID=A0ABZ2F2F1_METCP|nr:MULTISPECIES: 3-mercaptopyruvate sulfurtransferase [Methylococcus]MDF9391841.1 3-mercaptopyruvate sulfurtransferase [Methylococcus capsulatus]